MMLRQLQVVHFRVDDSQELALDHYVVRWDVLKHTAAGFVLLTAIAREHDAFDVHEVFVVKLLVANDVDHLATRRTLYDKAYGNKSEYLNSVHVACM